jgi:hypothetical protein
LPRKIKIELGTKQKKPHLFVPLPVLLNKKSVSKIRTGTCLRKAPCDPAPGSNFTGLGLF